MSENNTRKYADTEVATQHNQLINSQQSLSVSQKRIFYLALQQIRKGDKHCKRYYIDLSDRAPSESIYHQVWGELDDLMSKKIRFVEEINGFKYDTRLNLVSKSSHKKGTGQIYGDLHTDTRERIIARDD